MISAFADNSFLTQFFAFICLLTFGFAFACFLRIILPSKKHGIKSLRFAFMCFFLSLTVISYTILIFKSKSLSWPIDFSKSHNNYYLFLACIFFLGTLISFFWKILLPVSLIFYLSLSIFTNYLMTSIFGEQKNVIPISIEDNSSLKEVSIIHCPLPDIFILPIKRNWFFAGQELPEKDDRLLKNSLVKFYLENILLKNLKDVKSFPLPETKIFPSLYSAHIDFSDSEITCRIVKDL